MSWILGPTDSRTELKNLDTISTSQHTSFSVPILFDKDKDLVHSVGKLASSGGLR